MAIDKLEILKKMIRIRMVEQYIAMRYPEQKMRCPTHLCLGQEAVPAVFGYFAAGADIFVGTCRSHGHYFAKGGDLTALFAELLGSSTGCSRGFGGSMHIIDTENKFWGTTAIVAGGVPIAAGAAFSLKYNKTPQVVVNFLGDAAVEEGVVYETINFALLHKLPIIFVCENNRLAITTPIELRQCSPTIYNKFQGMGLPGFYVAENDIENLITVSEKSYDFAKLDGGPVLIEYGNSRWSVHVGGAFNGPVDAWWQEPDSLKNYACPICVLLHMLLENKIIDRHDIKKIKDEISTEIETSFQRAEKDFRVVVDDLEKKAYASPLKSELPAIAGRLDAVAFKYAEQSKLVNPF